MQTNLDEKIKKVLALIQEILEELEISGYIIGGQARNFWYMNQYPKPSITRDIDWVLQDKIKIDILIQRLIEKEGFLITNEGRTLISPEKIQIDVTIFHHDVHYDEAFLGLFEIFEKGVEEFIFEEKKYKIATVPAIILLKLIAFSQRPEHRVKDIVDIGYMLLYYDIYTEEGFPLFTEIAPEFISARIIGRAIGKIIVDSPNLINLISQILEKELNSPLNSKMAQIMAKSTEKPESEILIQIEQILIGLKE